MTDTIAEQIDRKEVHVLSSSIDLKHAYGQVSLQEGTAKHCSFQIIVGKSTAPN